MIPEKDYYTAPSDEVFEDIKQACIKLWGGYGDEYGYRSEKIGRIKDLQNISDNYAYMVAMFDLGNQKRLYRYIEREDTKKLLDKLTSFD